MTSLSSMSTPSSPALLMDDGVDTVSNVIVHPMVLLHVLDHHTRRQEISGRVIGTLLGRRDGKTVEVTNCFAVPHAERGDEVAIGKDFNKQMLSLHLRANRKEQVVGWYASAAVADDSAAGTPDLIADTSSLIHEFYAGESEEGDPIHLVVDTRLKDDSISVRAFRSTPVMVQGEPLANLFHELNLTMESTEPEAICLAKMVSEGGSGSDEATSVEPLLVSMEKLYNLLETASNYVDSVVEGKIAPDAELGRQVADTLATVPRIRPEVFDKLFNDSLQDLLMVTYLSNITKTQLSIAEKLNASLGV
jgi:translation initiation factor 3 subunit F